MTESARDNYARNEFRALDERAFQQGKDIELVDERLILRSPDGSRFYLAVANDGTLSATAL